MKHFSIYELFGIVVPGALVLFLLSLMYDSLYTVFLSRNLQIGDFGLFFILSYAIGQATQVLGNQVDATWWLLFGGKPSDWLRSGVRPLVSEHQKTKLLAKINRIFSFDSPVDYSTIKKKEWYAIFRQVHAYVADKGRAERADRFNANYGFNRAMSAGFLVVSLLCAINSYWDYCALSMLLFVAFLVRMSGYGVDYAQELVVQFLLD